MEIVRKNDGTADFLDDDGNVIGTLTFAKKQGGGAAAGMLLDTLDHALGGENPRVMITLKEGLLEDAQADVACQVLILEDDRFAEPRLTIRRRDIVVGERDSVTAALDDAIKKGAAQLE